MLTVADFPDLAGLDQALIAQLAAAAEPRLVRTGQHVLRRGTSARELLAVASGGLRVEPGGNVRPLLLGPGELVGEMAILTGQPVSAHVIAEKDSHLLSWPRALVLELLDRHEGLRAALTDVFVRRLRVSQPDQARQHQPQLALLSLPDERSLGQAWVAALAAACRRYAADVQLFEGSQAQPLLAEIEAWRADAPSDGLGLVAVPAAELAKLQGVVQDGDAVVRHTDRLEAEATAVVADWGLADHAYMQGAAGDDTPADPRGRWAFRLTASELGRDRAPTPDEAPDLHRLARWLTRRQVGIALSAGAALGFAHVGVLAELRRMGLPIDRLTGTSMGGVAALMYGMADDAEQAIEKIAWTLGRPHKRRWNLLGRHSLLSDRQLRRRAATIAAGRSLGDLSVPVSVVSSDLVRGERFVVDRGPVERAFFATGAVPGILPPVDDGDRVLVDGALVCRLPVDLLPARRCALRIAVNVIPSPQEAKSTHQAALDLRARLARPFGFAHALSASWGLLSWWHGARDAAEADLLIEPETADHSGLDFAEAWAELVESGRATVRAQADEIRAAAGDLIEPSSSTTP